MKQIKGDNNTAKNIAHREAMLKFTKVAKRFPNGFDFVVPTYRKDLFEIEMNAVGIVFYNIAESYADLHYERMSLLECIKKLDFRKRYIVVGVGIDDLVKRDFDVNKTIYTICYSVAPNKELLDARERTR